MMDSVPTVFITGQVRTDLIGTDGFQEADITGITMPIVKHSIMIQDPREIPQAIHEAFHIARSGRPGPGAGRHPAGPLARRHPVRAGRPTVHLPGYQPTTEGNAKQIRLAAKALANARRPVIYARRRRGQRQRGEGAQRALPVGPLPVTCTLMGLGGFPADRTSSGSGCSACTARAPPTTRWTRPT